MDAVTKVAIEISLFNYLIAQLPHHFDVQGLESMAIRIDEVETAVDSVVNNVLAVEATFVAQVP
jgi:hypothetical protein